MYRLIQKVSVPMPVAATKQLQPQLATIATVNCKSERDWAAAEGSRRYDTGGSKLSALTSQRIGVLKAREATHGPSKHEHSMHREPAAQEMTSSSLQPLPASRPMQPHASARASSSLAGVRRLQPGKYPRTALGSCCLPGVTPCQWCAGVCHPADPGCCWGIAHYAHGTECPPVCTLALQALSPACRRQS